MPPPRIAIFCIWFVPRSESYRLVHCGPVCLWLKQGEVVGTDNTPGSTGGAKLISALEQPQPRPPDPIFRRSNSPRPAHCFQPHSIRAFPRKTLGTSLLRRLQIMLGVLIVALLT